MAVTLRRKQFRRGHTEPGLQAGWHFFFVRSSGWPQTFDDGVLSPACGGETERGPWEGLDRFYFRSLYFREPNGILFEIATDGPGFHADEPMEHLGERLALPPFLEPRRAEIEAGLKPL